MQFKSSFIILEVAAINFCLIGGADPAAADILHVPGDFPTIQEAIGAAMDGDEVEVQPGTYNEMINFYGKAIRVYSTDGLEVTIIDAQQSGTTVTCFSGEGPDTILDGFTITGGNATLGGGMRNETSHPKVTNCKFIGNTAGSRGGGMYNTSSSSPTVTNCTFEENTSDFGGGGMYNHISYPKVTNCTFIGNIAQNIPHGAGMFNLTSGPTVTNCTFIGNTAAASAAGGGMYNLHGSPIVINSMFIGNNADFGGGMFNDDSSPMVINCTFSGNTSNSGSAMYNLNSSPTVTNCVLWGNSSPEIFDFGTSNPIITYCDIQGSYDGTGNIDADPLFVDQASNNFRLLPSSPCIDAADNTAVPKGVVTDFYGNPRFVDDPDMKDTGNGNPPIVDMGAYEYQPLSCPWDLDKSGSVGTGDLLELFSQWGTNGTADFDESGAVGTGDLLILFANWGPCP